MRSAGIAAFDGAGASSGALSGGIGAIVQGAEKLASRNLSKGLPIDEILSTEFPIHAMQDSLTAARSIKNIVTDGVEDISNQLDSELTRVQSEIEEAGEK